MSRRMMPWLVTAALTAALAMVLHAGVHGARSAPRGGQWDRRWPALARSGPRWREGAEFVMLAREGLLEGVSASRERWLLLRRDSIGGDFEVQRPDQAARVCWLPFHPAVPGLPLRSRRSPGVHPYACGLVAVTVPAGRFRCGRTWRNIEARDGVVMRVDEWWAPGVPVPVQRWTRWEGDADALAVPPRRVADMLVGTEWAVLERIRQP